MKLRFIGGSSLKKSFRTLFHWTVALLLLPCVWATLKILGLMLPQVAGEGVRVWWLYLAGALGYLIIDWFLFKPMPVYVFGHELTHVLSGLMSGAKIHGFKVGSSKGEVRLSKSNTFVALSPYVVPIYALATIGLYALLNHWWKHPALYMGYQVLLGSSVAFHLSMTVAAMHGRQPDLKIKGLFLSGVLIVLGNVLILGLFCVSLFHRTPTVKEYGKRLLLETAQSWRFVIRTTKQSAAWMQSFNRSNNLIR